MSASMEGSPESVTDSESSSPTKRTSRLNERIQRTRRHRQWVVQTSTPVNTKTTASPMSVSQQEKVRNKLTKVAESYQRHKKLQGHSPRSPADDTVSPKINGSKSIEQAVPFPDPQGDNDGTQPKLMYAQDRVTSRVAVPWPDTEVGDDTPLDSTPPTRKSPYSASFSSPVTATSWQKPSSQNRTPQGSSKTKDDNQSVRNPLNDEPAYKSVLELARARFEKPSIESTQTLSSVQPVSVKNSELLKVSSATKRYAPWEKRDDRATDVLPPKMASSTTPSHKNSSPQDDVSSQAGSGSARSTTWKRPQGSSPPPESGSKAAVSTLKVQEDRVDKSLVPDSDVKSKLASWQSPKASDNHSETDVETRSDVSFSSGNGVQSPVWKRPVGDLTSGPKLAPWQKPKASHSSSTGYTSKSPSAADVTHGTVELSETPHNDAESIGVGNMVSSHSPQPNASSQNPRSPISSYDISRQGTWQKPKSTARPPAIAPIQSEVSGRETPVQMWKRREQELKNAAVVKSEPKKLSYGQSDLHVNSATAGTEFASPKQLPRSGEKPNHARTSPSPSVGRVQSPSWVKLASSGYQAKRATQEEVKEAPWVKKQPVQHELEAELSPKRTINADIETSLNDYLNTPVPSDVELEPAVVEAVTTHGGAVIETPKSQSVASLRASLGSKPAPPPFMVSSPTIRSKSPGGSPWLAGNRSTGLGSNSSRVMKEKDVALSLPTLVADKTSTADAVIPVDQRSTISIGSTTTPVQSSSISRTESDSEATPVTSHVNHRAIAMRAAMLTDSPSKSLADMAADSVLITDYSHLQDGALSEYADDEDSFVDSGIGMIMPSPSNLPNEFHSIAETSSDEIPSQQRAIGGDEKPSRGDVGTTSVTGTSDDVDRRHKLQSRVETFGLDDHEVEEMPSSDVKRRLAFNKHVTPARGGASMKPIGRRDAFDQSNDGVALVRSSAALVGGNNKEVEEVQSRDVRKQIVLTKSATPPRGDSRSKNAEGRKASNVANVGVYLNRTEAPVEVERSEVGTSSTAVFGYPRTFGAAGGDETRDATPSVVDRAKAISAWNGGTGSTPRFVMDELDNILDGEDLLSEGEIKKNHVASRAANIFTFADFSGEEEDKWANLDPDIDADLMRDDSPSPEPEEYDEVMDHIRHEFYAEEDHNATSKSQTPKKVGFAPAPIDPFTFGEFPSVQGDHYEEEEEVLDPDQVFGRFWSGEGLSESFDFDAADVSFFSSTSNDVVGAPEQSPFRVVLKPPPSAPSNRSRRQREASEDYDLRYASYLANMEEWRETSGNIEI